MDAEAINGRRTMLRALGALVLGGAGALATRPAAALRPIDPGDLQGVLDEGCSAAARHRRLLDEAAARLGVSLTDEQARTVLAQLACPTCGCPLLEGAGPLTSAPF